MLFLKTAGMTIPMIFAPSFASGKTISRIKSSGGRAARTAEFSSSKGRMAPWSRWLAFQVPECDKVNILYDEKRLVKAVTIKSTSGKETLLTIG
jgi:hypothetical protein